MDAALVDTALLESTSSTTRANGSAPVVGANGAAGTDPSAALNLEVVVGSSLTSPPAPPAPPAPFSASVSASGGAGVGAQTQAAVPQPPDTDTTVHAAGAARTMERGSDSSVEGVQSRANREEERGPDAAFAAAHPALSFAVGQRVDQALLDGRLDSRLGTAGGSPYVDRPEALAEGLDGGDPGSIRPVGVAAAAAARHGKARWSLQKAISVVRLSLQSTSILTSFLFSIQYFFHSYNNFNHSSLFAQKITGHFSLCGK